MTPSHGKEEGTEAQGSWQATNNIHALHSSSQVHLVQHRLTATMYGN